MAQYDRDLSNLSYTNKDFQTIYPELLELVKSISYKWDPTVSNETDPGVILLKLNALMGDKLNYNIDKNILELFPVSVTQSSNARQIFEQCGYNMRHYNGATTKVTLKIVKEPEEEKILEAVSVSSWEKGDTRTYHIPRFTMVSDANNEFVYTIVEDIDICTDTGVVDVDAIQGVATKYSINEETLISTSHLDHNNRIYITDMDVAENGIFVVGSDGVNWEKVDNLMIQELGTKCYKFGLTLAEDACYIEFPSDIDSIIGQGVNITYIRTKGTSGNVARGYLKQFYGEVKANVSCYRSFTDTHFDYPEQVSVTTDNIYITNYMSAINGEDPETIDSAYKNYQKIRNTFDTLVSLKDYTNYIATNKMVSNGYVCDRTNDIQSSYKVLSVKNNEETLKTFVEESVAGVPDMNAFNLKIFGLRYATNAGNSVGYEDSYTNFHVVTTTTGEENIEAFNNIKCIQHDIIPLSKNKIAMLKNKYPITAKIIPQYKLTATQQSEVIYNVLTALQSALNSKEIAFGDSIGYDFVYDTIMGADNRIKAIILNNIEYETWAVYVTDENNFSEIRVDSNSDIYNIVDTVVKKPESGVTYYTKSDGVYSSVGTLTRFGTDTTYYTRLSDEEIELWNKFRTEIYTKSVLAGKTQLFKQDTRFEYSMNQRSSSIYENVYSADTDTRLEWHSNLGRTDTTTIKLVNNENIVFTCPNLIVDNNYSSYTKFFYKINHDIEANQDYFLEDGEYIMFFWKSTDSDTDPYNYLIFSGGNDNKTDDGTDIKIICPTFKILKDAQTNPTSGTAKYPLELDNLFNSLQGYKGHTTGDITWTKVEGEGESATTKSITTPMTDYIAGFSGSVYVLTGSNSIDSKKINSVHINNAETGSKNIFWITKHTVVEDGETLCCLPFTQCSSDGEYYEYSLKSGEYFMYANDTQTHLVMLGQGTRLSLKTNTATTWRCQSIDYDKLMSEGVAYITDNKYWYYISPTSEELIATEMEYQQLGSNMYVRFELGRLCTDKDAQTGEGDVDKTTIVIDSSGVTSTRFLESQAEGERRTTQDNLSGIIIEYSSDGNDFTRLSQKAHPSLSWNAYSILNLRCSQESEQQLLYKYNTAGYAERTHTIRLYAEDGNEIAEICSRTKGVTTSVTDYFMNASNPLTLTGGNGISTLYRDYSSTTGKATDFHTYSLVSNNDSDFFVENQTLSDSQLTLYKEPSKHGSNNQFELSLPVGEYVLEVEIPVDYSTFGIYHFDGGVHSLSDDAVLLLDVRDTISSKNIRYGSSIESQDENYRYNTAGVHYLNLSITSSSNQRIFFAYEGGDDTSKIKISRPYKYVISDSVPKNESNSSLLQTILLNMKTYDRDNLFNFTYVIPSDSLIANPLLADSFNDYNHIYNQYTICMWNRDKTVNNYLITATNNIK